MSQRLFLTPEDTDASEQEMSDLISGGHQKVAGQRLSSDARMWEQEITESIGSSLPYLPLEGMSLHFDRIDVVKGAAAGAAVFDGGVNVPFIIRRDRMGDGPELLPMDVYEHEGVLRPLTPTAIKSALLDKGIGEPMSQQANQKVRGQNPYIGDMTGDSSPLEYGGQISPFAGGNGMKTASLGKNTASGAVLGGIVGTSFQATRELEKAEAEAKAKGRKFTNKDRVKAIQKAVIRGGGVGAVAGAAQGVARHGMGIESQYKTKLAMAWPDFVSKVAAALHPNDLENFRQVMINNPKLLQAQNLGSVDFILRQSDKLPPPRSAQPSRQKMPNIMIVKGDPVTGQVSVKFPGEQEFVISSKEELKSLLGEKFNDAVSQIKANGLYVATENIQQASWSAKSRSAVGPSSITRDGLHAVTTSGGRVVTGYVINSIIRPDGHVYRGKMVVTLAGDYGFAGDLFGVRIGDKNRVPSTKPKKGAMGVFVVYANGTPVATTPMEIKSIVTFTAPNGKPSTMINARDSITGDAISLVPSRSVHGFVAVKDLGSHNPMLTQAKGDIYYAPEGAEFVELKMPLKMPRDENDLVKVGSTADGEGEVHVHRNRSQMWTFSHRQASMDGLTDTDAYELLAGMGVKLASDIKEIETNASCDDGVTLTGLMMPSGHGFEEEKIASVEEPSDAEVYAAQVGRMDIEMFKLAQDIGDRDTVDAVLSLNFLNPENMKTFVEQCDEFDKIGTKLAKLLVATRLGLNHVREATVKEAMDGIARTADQLRLLKSAYGHSREQAHGAM